MVAGAREADNTADGTIGKGSSEADSTTDGRIGNGIEGGQIAALAELIVDVPDFPKPGIAFKDITPLLADPAGFRAAVEGMVSLAPPDIDLVVGMEARGFLFAAPLALRLGAGFAPVRKPGKLPRETLAASYTLEYRSETLTMHADAVRPGQRVLIVDDVLATGGTARATADLVSRRGGLVAAVVVLLELGYLDGRVNLSASGLTEVRALLTVPEPPGASELGRT